MRCLALDTATPDEVTGVVDIASGELTEKVIEDTRLLSEQLMPAVEEAIAKQQRGYAAIDAIAVGVGPGPFLTRPARGHGYRFRAGASFIHSRPRCVHP